MAIDLLIRQIAESLDTDLSAKRDPARLKAARSEFLQAETLVNTLEHLNLGKKSIQVVRASQRLLLLRDFTSRVSNSEQVELDERLTGSCRYALGVKPEDLDSSGRADDVRQVRENLGIIESHLAARVRGWSEILSASSPASSSITTQADGCSLGTSASSSRAFGVNHQSLSKGEGLSMIVAQRKATVRYKQQAVQRELFKLLRMTAGLLNMYQSIDKDVLAFADQEVITHQANIDQKNLEFDVCWVDVMAAKLRAIEVQMEAQTYTSGHVRALTRVHDLIQEQLEATRVALTQVTMKLESYQALGPGFKGLARDYGVVKQQLAETKGMLAKFDDLKTELADNWV